MRSSSTFAALTLVCISCQLCGCIGQSSVETAVNEDDGSAADTAQEGPAIPSSMLPGIPGAGQQQTHQQQDGQQPAGQQPPVPNYPAVQPPATTPPAFDPNLPPAGGERFRAEAGVGKQGQSLQNEKGIGAMIVTPARSLFAVKQRTVFEIQIPKSMQLFEATQGRKPKSHEEFMSAIIKANLIQLPELPAGQTYIYDPQLGELMVQKPGG